MKLKTILFVVLASVTALTGCDDKTSVEWYMAHHDDLLKKYGECFANHNFQPEDCQHARSAIHREMNKPDVLDGYHKIIEEARKNRHQEPIADLN